MIIMYYFGVISKYYLVLNEVIKIKESIFTRVSTFAKGCKANQDNKEDLQLRPQFTLRYL